MGNLQNFERIIHRQDDPSSDPVQFEQGGIVSRLRELRDLADLEQTGFKSPDLLEKMFRLRGSIF